MHGELRQVHHDLSAVRRETQSAAPMPEMRLAGHQFGCKAGDGEQLLALLEVRRRLESVTAPRRPELVAAITNEGQVTWPRAAG
jgi:hypothetical protein